MSIKNNTTSLLDLLEAVNALPEASEGVELPTLTNEGSASDLLSGKQLIDQDGNIVTGTIETVPQAKPSITINSSGLITASATQIAGYVDSGTKSTTKQLTTQAAKTITPTKSSQNAVASGVYTTGAITVDAIPDEYITTTDATASADEIMNGEIAYVNGSKVTGTFTIDEELSTQDDLITQIQAALVGKTAAGGVELPDLTNPGTAADLLEGVELIDGDGNVVVGTIPVISPKTVSLTNSKPTYTIPAGKHDGTGVVEVGFSTIQVTPKKEYQNYTGVYDNVLVDPIPDKYQDISGVTAGYQQVLYGYTIVNSKGQLVQGSIETHDPETITLDADTTQHRILPGYHTGNGIVQIDPTTVIFNPTKERQEKFPPSGRVYNRAIVNAIPSKYQDVTEVTATAADVLVGKKIVTSDGSVVEGTLVEGSGGSGDDEFVSYLEGTLGSQISNSKVTKLGDGALALNSYLTTVDFPNCALIGNNAFNSCPTLTEVNFSTCTSIGETAFFFCSNLTSLSFPNCITLDYGVFYQCSKLSIASFPACTTIGSAAFYNCNKLKTANFPSCTTIGSTAFYRCTSLSSAIFPNCSEVFHSAFYYCSSIVTASFPLCVQVYDSVFYNCSKLTNADFPICSSVGTYAFGLCRNLTSINISNCSTINNSAFYGCSSITSLNLNMCNTIGSGAFSGCTKLTSLTLASTAVATLGNITAFNSTPMSLSTLTGSFGSIYVPASLVTTYQSATNWATYSARITAIPE